MHFIMDKNVFVCAFNSTRTNLSLDRLTQVVTKQSRTSPAVSLAPTARNKNLISTYIKFMSLTDSAFLVITGLRAGDGQEGRRRTGHRTSRKACPPTDSRVTSFREGFSGQVSNPVWWSLHGKQLVRANTTDSRTKVEIAGSRRGSNGKNKKIDLFLRHEPCRPAREHKADPQGPLKADGGTKQGVKSKICL